MSNESQPTPLDLLIDQAINLPGYGYGIDPFHIILHHNGEKALHNQIMPKLEKLSQLNNPDALQTAIMCAHTAYLMSPNDQAHAQEILTEEMRLDTTHIAHNFAQIYLNHLFTKAESVQS